MNIPCNLYLLRVQSSIDTLSWVWTEIDAIKRNAPHVSDEIVMKMYGPDADRIASRAHK